MYNKDNKDENRAQDCTDFYFVHFILCFIVFLSGFAWQHTLSNTIVGVIYIM